MIPDLLNPAATKYPMPVKYRPEIDGLRAIAVLLVVLYHARPSILALDMFAGGFIGVDIFFVISGYLITSVVLHELEEQAFTFAHFYERRARRILPALFTVMLACLPFAWMHMLPKAMKEFAGSGLSALFFGSNVWFWQEDSYTAAPSALKPLLHTWSLSVEEQFYLLFPLALVLFWRFLKSHISAVMIVGLLISLQFAHHTCDESPAFAFFLFPTRAWELLTGSLLAKLTYGRGRLSHSILDATMPALGLSLVLGTVIFFDDTINHPSYITCFPIIGTALLIWFMKPGELITNVLSTRLFVAIGLISYALYLWHFPLFAFARMKSQAPTQGEMLACIGIAFVLSGLSFFLIERPARQSHRICRRNFYSYSLAAFLTLLAAYGGIYYYDGIPSRLGVLVDLYERARPRYVVQDGTACRKQAIDSHCRFETSAASTTLILVGDSHARTLAVSLLDAARANRANYAQLTSNACLPVYGTIRSDGGKDNTKCRARTQDLKDFLAAQEPSTIVLSGRFPLILNGSRFDNREGGLEPAQDVKPSLRLDEFATPGDTVVAKIHGMIREWLDLGHTVVIVYPIPEVGWHVPNLVKGELDQHAKYQQLRAFKELEITTSYPVFKQRSKLSSQILDGVGEHPRLHRVFPDQLLCLETTQRCYTHDKSRLFYTDDDHLAPYTAQLVTDQIATALGWQSGTEDHLK